MIIKGLNPATDAVVSTGFSLGEAANVGTLRVKNISGFSANWAIQLGKTGEEQSEIRVLSASTPSGTALVVTANTSFEHPVDTPIYAIKYDQLIFKRNTAGTSGSATPLTNGTIYMTPDQLFTQFDDTSGAATFGYKIQYRNSVTTDLSSESDWLTPEGYTFYSLGKLIERVKAKLYNPQFIKSDDVIIGWVNEWKEMMDNAAVDVNKDYSLGTTTVSFSGTTELGTITATDYKDMRRVWFTGDGQSYFNATKMESNEFNPNQTFSQTHPYFYMVGDNVMGRKPSTGSGTASILYYKFNPVLTDYTDELPTVQHNYTKAYVDYCLSQAYMLDNKQIMSQSSSQMAFDALNRFKQEISARLKTGTTMIRQDEVVSGEDDGWGF